MKVFKNVRKVFVVPILCCAFMLSVNVPDIFAATTYYNSVQKQTITKGLTYEKSIRVTDARLLEVHVLKVDMDSPNLTISTIKSKMEYGIKETTSKLVNDNGAIAGVNGDFFGLEGKYSIPMGVEVADGKLLSINEDSNEAGYGNATFFIDKNNNPFITYMRSEVHFMTDGAENIKISTVNKIFDLGVPAIITSVAMETTKDIDARIPEVVKLVCEDGVIKYISQRGETVTVPPNGYIVAMNGITANEKAGVFKIGQRAEFFLRPTIDIATIQNAITGAGKILTEGAVADDGGTVAGGRHPRTAVGITKDKKQIIIMAVDGRTHSIGANQKEMASLMIEYGAYEAMHLDGGGSTTMAVVQNGMTDASVVNTLSDGSQRKVINALGIFNDAPVGDIKTIVVETPSKYVMKNSSVKVKAYGMDEYNHIIELSAESLSFTASEGGGAFLDGYFTPTKTGPIVLTVTSNNLTGNTTIYSEEIAEIISGRKEIKTFAGGTAELSFSGKTQNGRTVSVDNSALTYEVVPADLGSVANGVFTANKTGAGWIKCSSGDISSYVPVYSTLNTAMVNDFENKPPVKGTGYPEIAFATAEYTNTNVTGGLNAVSFTYKFSPSGETQAAYAMFEPRIAIQNKASALKLSVFGDSSNHWLRSKIFDANEKEYTIDFAKNIDWTGWKEVTAAIPAEVTYPITLERIYAASLSETEESTHTIYFDDLKGMFEGELPKLDLPKNTVYTDRLSYTMDNEPGGLGITFMPSVYFNNGKNDKKPDGYLDARKKAMNSLFKNSSRSIYMANEDIKEEAGKQIKYNNGVYTTETLESVLLIGLNSKSGGFMQSDVSQWGKIKADISGSTAGNVILYTDLSPFSFKQQKEFELFHNMLVELQQSGKTIFVVSDEWVVNSVNIKDGIRYINVGKMYNSDGTINDSFSILRFKVNGSEAKYCIDKLAK